MNELYFNFHQYIARNNQFVRLVTERYPQWTVVNDENNWNCRITIPAQPQSLIVSVATLPLPGNNLYEIMIIQSMDPIPLDNDINAPKEGELIQFQTADQTITYLANAVYVDANNGNDIDDMENPER